MNINHLAVIANHLNPLKVMALPYLKIIGVMSRRDLYCPCPICHIDIFISDNRDFAISEGQLDFCANQMLIPLVIWVDRYRYVTEHGLWARSSNNNLSDMIECRVGNVVELAFFIFVHHLNITKTRLVFETIIHHTLAPIDQPVIPKLLERAIDSRNHLLVQRKHEVFPACACPEGPQLQLHVAPLTVNKIPHL